MNGIKRIISLILITAMTVIPVYAEEVNEEYIPYQEEYSYEPIVHEEILDYDIEIDEEEYELKFAAVAEQEEGIQTYSAGSWTDASIWDLMYRQTYGFDYLSPAMKSKDTVSVSGKTNKLSISNTDLCLPGKNGMDLVIQREYDNQYNNYSYVGMRDTGAYTVLHKPCYIYDMINTEDNSVVKIGVYTKDEYYMYMQNGMYLTDISNRTPVTYRPQTGGAIEFHRIQEIKYYITNEENSVLHLIPSGNEPLKITERPSNYVSEFVYDIKILTDSGNLGSGFRLQFPEVFLERTYAESDTSEYPKYYEREYYGSFRGLDGQIFTIDGDVSITKYKDGTTRFQSTYSSANNYFMDFEGFYDNQTIEGTTREYNYKITDRKTGYTYYFNGPILTGLRINMIPVAIYDEFGNSILYDTDENGKISKITDTYGREINFTYREGITEISYSEGNETKTIKYQTEILPATAMENDSLLNGKPVYKFIYTNENNESTSYYAREGELPVYLKWGYIETRPEAPTDYYSFDIEADMMTATTYNVEKIEYPTGKESNIRYKPLYYEGGALRIKRGYYVVSERYDIYGDTVQNKINYEITGSKEITIKETDQDETVTENIYSQYNNLIKINKVGTGVYYTYTYSGSSIETQTEYFDGITTLKEYTYYYGYPGMPVTESDGKIKKSYIYHSRNNKLIPIPRITEVQKKNGSRFETDYTITTALTEDGKKIAYEEATKNNVVQSRVDYTYNSWGDIASKTTKLNDSENLTVNISYEITEDKELDVTYSTPGTTDADGVSSGVITQSHKFNIHGNPISATDELGNVTEIEYDNTGRVTKHIYPNNGNQIIEYDFDNKEVIVTDVSGAKYKYIYDDFERIIKVFRINEENIELLEEYAYDDMSRVKEKKIYFTSTTGKKEEYTYDKLGRVLTEKISKIEDNEWLYTNNYTYTTENLKWNVVSLSITSADNIQVSRLLKYYNRYNKLEKTEKINGSKKITELYEYDSFDNLIKYTDPKGNIESYTYDIKGNLLTTVRADNSTSSNSYDLAGRKISSTDYMGNTTTYNYDNLSRLVSVSSPLDERNSIQKFYYDKKGNQIKKKVQKDTNEWLTEEYSYDSMGNLTGMTAGDGTEKSAVKYTYDLSGNILTMTTGIPELTSIGGKTTTYEYTPFGKLIKETDPMGYSKSYSYDLAGNTVSITDKNNQNINYTYDIFGMKTEVASDVSNSITRDSLGREKIKISNNITDNISYDPFGRVTEIISGNISKIYSYDNNSNVTSFILKDNNITKQTVSYTYNNLNQVTSITDNGITSSFSYNPNGKIISKTTGNISTAYEYNKAGLLTKITGADTYEAEYYLNGMKSSEDNSSYTYDSLGRLKAVSGNNSVSYIYDLNGNRISETTVDGNVNYVYDDNNRLVSETKGNEYQINWFYDNNGNVISERELTSQITDFNIFSSNPGGVKFYSYDGLNRLVSYSDENSEASYMYGADNLRRAKTVNNQTTNFSWNGQNMVYETAGETANIYGYDVTGISYANMNGIIYFYEKDIHGNISVILNSNGTAVESNTYTAFGEKTDTDTISTPFGYCGEYTDEESGLIYLRNRYYVSTLGRFLTEDPVKDGTNWYVYCGNNPINLIDPLGLYEKGDEKLPSWANELINGKGGYTEQWVRCNEINDKAGMDAAHTAAETIRRRAKAVEIALYYDDKTYYENGFHFYDRSINASDGSDCTNFVSICLNGAGIPMNDSWYWNSYTTGGLRGLFGKSTTDASPSWLNPDPFYRYFTQPENSNGVAFISKGADLRKVPNDILPGDVIAFNNFESVAQGIINHIGIVTSIQDDGIHYSGHNISREDVSLYEKQNGFNGDIYIIRIKY